ncbi:cadherin-related family member 5-like [Conger conger]|uniref:cadherin-related family member 5-like n=1 Tax=Conger conger TaxID=82655 RepID=UPI002A5992AF|nr:cadherin-related family member 5-like [Conger conger]
MITHHTVKANLCLGGQNIFATVRENSPTGEFIANLTIIGDPAANSLNLHLTGENADWFFLEGKTIRLNSSFSRALDREVQGSILMAALTCYEDNTIQSEYRIMVEILNENDNRPAFLEHTIQPFHISELTEINTVAFTVQASDEDEDIIMYILDQNWPDSRYFRIDLPNSGKVILDKPLDYEIKTQLRFVIYAVEMNTKEKNSATATITVYVLDGDDQYPHFLPCTPLSKDETHPICINPIYIVNITEKDQARVLYFSPGPIYAEDGDRGLRTPLLYRILSGADKGRFRINNETGEVVLTRPVENRLLTPTHRLRIMAFQIDDPKKYTVGTALVRVLAENRFPPQFNQTTYKGFVTENSGPAVLVSSYEKIALVVQATDLDFRDGVNPHLQYSLWPKTKNSRLYRITQEGLLIARTNQLRSFEKNFMEVLATDPESGEVVKATIDIEVLQKGQGNPQIRADHGSQGHFGQQWRPGRMNVGMAWGVAVTVLLLLGAAFVLFLQLVRRRRQQQDLADRGSVALGKHPNVVNHGRAEIYRNEAFDNGSTSSHGQGKHGMYTKKTEMAAVRPFSWDRDGSSFLTNAPPVFVVPMPPPGSASSSILSNGKTSDRSAVKSVSFKEEGIVKDQERCGEGQPSSGGVEMHTLLHPDCITSWLAATTASVPAEPGQMGERHEEDRPDEAKPHGHNTVPESSEEQEHSMCSDDDDDDDYDDDNNEEIYISVEEAPGDDNEGQHSTGPSYNKDMKEPGENGGQDQTDSPPSQGTTFEMASQ